VKTLEKPRMLEWKGMVSPEAALTWPTLPPGVSPMPGHEEARVESHVGLSALAFLCCIPLGVPALILSCQVGIS
jgi:hypothetical protein